MDCRSGHGRPGTIAGLSRPDESSAHDGEDSSDEKYRTRRTPPRSRQSNSASGSSRSTTSSSRATAAASSGCCRRSGTTPARRASACRSPPSPPTSTRSVAEDETPLPGSQEIERRIKSLVRWNAMAMVVRANRASDGIGGHISTYASAATLYEVGFNHFFRGKGTGRRRRHHLLPGPRLARHLRARVPRRPAVGREAAQLPPRARAGRRPVVVSAPVADAGLLGVPDGLDGPRPDHVDLPGALQPLPRRSRPEEAVEQPRSGRFSATARPTSPNRSAPSAWRRARSSTT